MSTSTSTLASTSASVSSSKPPQQLPLFRRPRRFAPLNPDIVADGYDDAPRLKGIVFDVDGTLCLPQNYMFAQMRAALSIPKTTDILDHIRSLSTTADQPPTPTNPFLSSPQSRARTIIEDIESGAMTTQEPQPGLTELMTYLTSHSIPKALCTRNFPLPVRHLLDTFLPDQVFDPIITRETVGVLPKPSPEGIWMIAAAWEKASPSSSLTASSLSSDPLSLARTHLGAHLIMVGDSVDDMAAGYRAGAATVLLVNEDNEHLLSHEYTDLGIRRLDELVDILDSGFVGRAD